MAFILQTKKKLSIENRFLKILFVFIHYSKKLNKKLYNFIKNKTNIIQHKCNKGFAYFSSLPFEKNIGDILKVLLGEYDVSTTAEPLRHEEINITEILIHPGFNNSTLVHDIALLKLEKPAKRKQVNRWPSLLFTVLLFEVFTITSQF